MGWQLTGACRARYHAKPAPQEPLLLVHVVVGAGQEPLVFVIKALPEGLSFLADLSLEDRSLSEETAEVGGLLRRHSHFLLDEQASLAEGGWRLLLLKQLGDGVGGLSLRVHVEVGLHRLGRHGSWLVR